MINGGHRKNLPQGFTLMEIVLVIVLLGILGAAGGDFISLIFRGFADTESRLEIYEEGKAALVRMERELHGMLPNAVCITNDGGLSCASGTTGGREIRFGMILEEAMRSGDLTGGYREEPVNFPRNAPATLSELNTSAVIPVGAIVSVYNTGWAGFATGARLYQITSVAGNEMTFSGQTIQEPSPQRRYYLVDRGVSYRWDETSGILYRSTVAVNSGGLGAFTGSVEYPLATGVSDCTFYYAAPSLARNGIVSIVFTMAKGGQNVNMHKEIHVKNVP